MKAFRLKRELLTIYLIWPKQKGEQTAHKRHLFSAYGLIGRYEDEEELLNLIVDATNAALATREKNDR
jgi:hypothetical protein